MAVSFPQLFLLAGLTVPLIQAQVSVDLLRHPIKPKVRSQLQSALAKMQSGDHEAAIGQLRRTLAKYPESAAHAYSLLGVEYVKTERYELAVDSFERAVVLLPHDPWTHHNLGLSLVCLGDYERGQAEIERALELDPANAKSKEFLAFLLQRKRSGN
jgi:tetratricopeptide (TPR) repeat protein